MRMRMTVCLCVLALGVGLIGPAMAQTEPAGEVSAPSASDLVYQGMVVKTQVDVNGAAAVQLVGGLLDAAAAAIQEQAKAAQQGGAAPQNLQGPQAHLMMVAPMIGPAHEIIESLDRITVLLMTPSGEVAGDQFTSHYQEMMQDRGWVPLLLVRGQGMPSVASLMAPEGKGVFIAVAPGEGQDDVVALLTTTKPIGDLLGQLASAGQGAMPQLMAMMNRPKPAPPAPPAKPAPPQKKPAARKK